MSLLALAVTGRGVVDPDLPAVHADDEAFLRGRAAFETVRVYGGRPFRLEEHLLRLAASAARLGLPGVDRPELETAVEQALAAAATGDCALRFYWTPGREGQDRPIGLALVRELPSDLEELRRRGLRLVTLPLGLDGPGLLAGVKSTSYALNMFAIDEARRRGADDAVLLGRGGAVLEAPTSNVWWRRDRTLCTPALASGILAGVTRAFVCEAAASVGYEVREGQFALPDLAAAEEVFTTASIREVMPVASLDGKAFPLGPAAAALQAALRAAATDDSRRTGP